jgi:hypothetical protein
VSDIQRVLSSIKENDFHNVSEAEKTMGSTVYVPKETSLKEMATKIE